MKKLLAVMMAAVFAAAATLPAYAADEKSDMKKEKKAHVKKAKTHKAKKAKAHKGKEAPAK